MRFVVLTFALLAFTAASANPATPPPSNSQTWLVLSDIHLNPFDRSEDPALVGSDTNLALFDQTLAQMKRFVPDPSMVLLPGDFLAHGFSGKVHANAPTLGVTEAALRTMARIASSLGKTYPHAHFAIALGNNDASCGDYKSDAENRYLRRLARIWEPLIDRDGSAPDFIRSFPSGGYYTAELPVRGLRLVVLNTVPMSSGYAGNCDVAVAGIARSEFAWLRDQLAAAPPGTSNILMMHIPPGYDPVSTQFAHGFLAWSFLHENDNATLLSLLGNPSSRVRYAIAGHMHKFDFRVSDSVPILIFSSLSPVYRNNPAFFAMRVGGDGSIDDIDTYAYDEWSGDWADGPRSFDRKWNVRRIDTQSLTALHARLGIDAALRAEWAFGSVAWPTNSAFTWDAWTGRWRIPWCAQSILASGYAQCADIENRVNAFRAALAAAAIGILAAVALLVLGVRRRRTR